MDVQRSSERQRNPLGAILQGLQRKSGRRYEAATVRDAPSVQIMHISVPAVRLQENLFPWSRDERICSNNISRACDARNETCKTERCVFADS